MEKRDSVRSILKGMGMAARLGLAGMLGASAIAEAKLAPNATGLGYKQTAASMNYEQVIKDISTPEEAIFYRDNCIPYATDKETYGQDEYFASFKQIHAKGKDDCDGVALAMAALLSDNGYKPQVLSLVKKVSMLEKSFLNHSIRPDDRKRAENGVDSHLIFPYQDKQTGKWGCIGVGRLEDRKPIYNTLDEMVATLKSAGAHNSYEIKKSEFNKGMLDLDYAYGREKWIAGDGSLGWNAKHNPAASKYITEQLYDLEDKAPSREEIINRIVNDMHLCSRRDAEFTYQGASESVQGKIKDKIAARQKQQAEDLRHEKEVYSFMRNEIAKVSGRDDWKRIIGLAVNERRMCSEGEAWTEYKKAYSEYNNECAPERARIMMINAIAAKQQREVMEREERAKIANGAAGQHLAAK